MDADPSGWDVPFSHHVYLTGASLGGSGTWYLATRYPDRFAAIAPMSGFTGHMQYIDEHLDRLLTMPIWAFHGSQDTVVPVEETERIVRRLKGRNPYLRSTLDPNLGHEIHWKVYPNQEIYGWLLGHRREGKGSLGETQRSQSLGPRRGSSFSARSCPMWVRVRSGNASVAWSGSAARRAWPRPASPFRAWVERPAVSTAYGANHSEGAVRAGRSSRTVDMDEPGDHL